MPCAQRRSRPCVPFDVLWPGLALACLYQWRMLLWVLHVGCACSSVLEFSLTPDLVKRPCFVNHYETCLSSTERQRSLSASLAPLHEKRELPETELAIGRPYEVLIGEFVLITTFGFHVNSRCWPWRQGCLNFLPVETPQSQTRYAPARVLLTTLPFGHCHFFDLFFDLSPPLHIFKVACDEPIDDPTQQKDSTPSLQLHLRPQKRPRHLQLLQYVHRKR